MDIQKQLCQRLEYAERLSKKAKTVKELSYAANLHNQITKDMIKHELMKEYEEIMNKDS